MKAGAAVAALLLAGACEQQHTVQLQLGPTADEITIGFRCRADGDPDHRLIERALTGPGTGSFNLVIDLVDTGDRFLGCRGEELVASCRGDDDHPPCAVTAADQPQRYCRPVPITPGTSFAATAAAVLATIESLDPVTLDAPGRVVVVRAVATQQHCDALESAYPDGTYPALDPDDALGCAYSCPVRLDDVEGTLTLTLDALSDRCESAVRICSALGAPP